MADGHSLVSEHAAAGCGAPQGNSQVVHSAEYARGSFQRAPLGNPARPGGHNSTGGSAKSARLDIPRDSEPAGFQPERIQPQGLVPELLQDLLDPPGRFGNEQYLHAPVLGHVGLRLRGLDQRAVRPEADYVYVALGDVS